MLNTRPVTVVEVPPFSAQSDAVWSEEERHEFIDFIAYNPLAGAEIPGTGGLRKVRWKRQGIGKRSGVRVVYFFYNETAPIFLLTVYAKGWKEDLSPEEKKMLSAFAKVVKAKMKSQS
jgi:hypothetical protein